MSEENNQRITEPFDPGVSREEAEDWLNDLPLFGPEGEDVRRQGEDPQT
jgi:hypothetical protein